MRFLRIPMRMHITEEPPFAIAAPSIYRCQTAIPLYLVSSRSTLRTAPIYPRLGYPPAIAGCSIAAT